MMKSNKSLAVGAVLLILILGSGLSTNSFVSWKAFGILTAVWLTFCIFSFLYRDNPFYKLAEHVMVGFSMGYFAIYYTYMILERQWWDRLILGELRPTDQLFGSAQAFRYALIIPAVFGLLMLTRVSSKIGWLSRWSMGVAIGLGSGIAIPWTIQGNITTQLLVGTRIPLLYVSALHNAHAAGLPGWVASPAWAWQIGAPILIVGTICGLIYFFFSVPHRGVIGDAAKIGIWVLMIGFGASFGLTVMARLSLFIGRIIFILKTWLHVPWLVG